MSKSNPFAEGALPPPKKKLGRRPDPSIVSRDQEIARRRATGEMSLAELAAEYGVSGERVRQICVLQGVDQDAANAAHARYKRDVAYVQAEKYEGALLMRYISGESPAKMARSLGLQIKAVQELLEEKITDEVSAARSRALMNARFPHTSSGPKEFVEPRQDRIWDPEKITQALIDYARKHNGRLPNSTEYQKISSSDETLPSFSTIRNRLGRWTTVRADIHRLISQGVS